MSTAAVRFQCGRCRAFYPVLRRNATAYIFLTDHLCNHVQASCELCGHDETVFLTPEQIGRVIEAGTLRARFFPNGDADLRARSEKAWKQAATSKRPPPADDDGAEVTLPTHDLTPRLEAVVEQFVESLSTIPDDLLHDGFDSECDRPWPERWTE